MGGNRSQKGLQGVPICAGGDDRVKWEKTANLTPWQAARFRRARNCPVLHWGYLPGQYQIASFRGVAASHIKGDWNRARGKLIRMGDPLENGGDLMPLIEHGHYDHGCVLRD